MCTDNTGFSAISVFSVTGIFKYRLHAHNYQLQPHVTEGTYNKWQNRLFAIKTLLGLEVKTRSRHSFLLLTHLQHFNQRYMRKKGTWAAICIASHFCVSNWKQKDCRTCEDDVCHHCLSAMPCALLWALRQYIQLQRNSIFHDSLSQAPQICLHQKNNRGQISWELKEVSTLRKTNPTGSTTTLFRLWEVQ